MEGDTVDHRPFADRKETLWPRSGKRWPRSGWRLMDKISKEKDVCTSVCGRTKCIEVVLQLRSPSRGWQFLYGDNCMLRNEDSKKECWVVVVEYGELGGEHISTFSRSNQLILKDNSFCIIECWSIIFPGLKTKQHILICSQLQ